MKILLATDGSKSAEAAVDFLIRFPFPKDSEVTVFTVLHRDLFGEDEDEELSDEQRKALLEAEEAVREEGERLIASEVQRLRNAGWGGSTEVRHGHPAQEIIEAAEDLEADLIVVGSKGLTGLKRFALGSVSHDLLHYASCSLLIVKPPIYAEAAPEVESERWRVLIAYDNSEPAKQAVELCASLPVVGEMEINAVTVLPLVTLYRQDVRQRLSSFWHQKRLAAEAALDWVQKEVSWRTPNVSVELREAPDVGHEILDATEEFKSDLVMLGDKGKSAIERFLLGSVTRRVAAHSPCSVWVVRDG